MAVTRLVPPAGASVQPVGASGTYTLSVPLTPGLYKITTDTSQNLSNTQLYFQTAEGFRFGAVVRGGQGYVAIPLTVTTVTFTAGTFPLLIGFERFSSYQLIAAPTTTIADVTYQVPIDGVNSSPAAKLDLAFTAPGGAASVGIYWSNGTFSDLSTTTSPKVDVVMPVTPAIGSTFEFLVVAKDANGVWGLGTRLAKVYPYQVFRTSGTYTPPAGSTAANVLVIGGGGRGGGGWDGTTGSYYGRNSGGGAGAAVLHTNVATVSPVGLTIGAGGAASGRTASHGGATTFGALTSNGGFGAEWNAAGGNSAAGFTGGTYVGGGAGNTANGGNGTGSASGAGGNGGAGSTFFGRQFAGGGGGWGSPRGLGSFGGGDGANGEVNGFPATSYGSGGGGSFNNTAARYGGAGGNGVVVVEAIFE